MTTNSGRFAAGIPGTLAGPATEGRDGSTVPPRRGPGRGPAAGAFLGLVSVGLAIAVAELVAALGEWLGPLGVSASPLSSLGQSFIALTPEWLKDFAVRTFGQHDKDALRVGMGIVLVIIAMLIGIIGRRWRRSAVGVLAALVAVAVAAVVTRPGSSWADAIPTVLGGVCGVWFLNAGLGRGSSVVPPPGPDPVTRSRVPRAPAPGLIPDRMPGRPGPADAPAQRVPASLPETDYGRRAFLRFAAFGAVAALVAGALSRWVPSTADVVASRDAVALPKPVAAQSIPPNAEFHIPGLTPFVTPDDRFYRVDTAFVVPRVTTEQWRLRVHGLVRTPIEIGYSDLLRMPLQDDMITLTCVSNEVGGGLTGNATWLGARLQDLLAKAGPTADADCVLSTSTDAFTVTTPLQALTDGRDALLAVGMNGQPLPIEHGFPVRMVVPGLYGYVSATKWVVDLEVTRFAEVTAYWTDRGWSATGPIKTSSRIDVPADSANVAAGRVAVAGVAWAQHRGISAVQVQVDGGPWQAARLSAPVNVDTWRQWAFDWDATPGTHTLRCRAIDGTGMVQISQVSDVIPNGATGLDSHVVTVTA